MSHPPALNRLGWLLAGVLAIFVVASFAGVVRGGPLDPPGAPSSTLPQVEPRIPIRQPASAGAFPIVINGSGSYFLTQNITAGAAPNGINITASDVTLDLNGFTLSGADIGNDGIAISGAGNVTVINGTLRDWLGVGVRDVTGLGGGRYEQLNLISNNGGGIIAGKDSSVTDCIATENGGNGIAVTQPSSGGSSIVRGCVVDGSVLDGIQVDYNVTVSGNTVTSSGVDAIHVLQSGNRIDSNNVAPANLGKAIHVEGTNNVIVRNSVRGANSDVSIVPGNTAGQFQVAGDPIANPWANIGY